MPLEIQPQSSFAKMTTNTLLEVLSPSDQPPGVAQQDSNSHQSTNSGLPVDEGPWTLRLQRPPDGVNELKDLEVIGAFMSHDRSSMELSKITCPLISCLFLNSKTGAKLGLQSGSFVGIAKKRPLKNDPKGRILQVVLDSSISPMHCSVHDLIASDLQLKYCQSVYVSLSRPCRFDMMIPFNLEVRPVKALSNEAQSEYNESNASTGVQYLKQVITGVLGIDMFHSTGQETSQSEANGANRGLISRTKNWAYSFWNSITDLQEYTKQDSESTHEVKSGDPLGEFLSQLILSWIKLQIQEKQNQQNLQKLPFSSNQLIKFQLQGARSGIQQEQDLLLRLEVSVKQGETLDTSNGLLLDPDRLEAAIRAHRCHLILNELQSETLTSPETFPADLKALVEPSWTSDLHKECLQYIKPAFMDIKESSIGCSCAVVISGAKQSGKTSFISGICKNLSSDLDILAHICYIPCRKIWRQLNENFGAFSKQKTALFQMISKAASFQPSIVVLDDLDSWSLESSDPVTSRSTMMIKDLMDQTRSSGASVVFLVTCSAPDQLDEGLISSRIFDVHLQLPQLNSSIRSEIFKFIFESNGVQMESEMTGVMPQGGVNLDVHDLERLCQRAMHCNRVRSINPEPLITKEDLNQALEDFQPSCSWKVSKSNPKGTQVHSLEDVGGTQEIKEAFHDSIELPLKYPELMKQCPLRLMSNLLLYGPPGTGKTFIITALAQSLDLRLISVKGPELLNKYIGQSEAGVRNVFKTAIEAAPCLLFFDEFEALGRHRGSDTSGVADRIVNQLLAEMDGVESLNGICILAATSRPDLIDKALLRPGRLDKHVFCGLPEFQERCEILKKTARNQLLDSEVDLNELAARTDGYSGADLASIISEAHLHAIGQILRNPVESRLENQAKEVEISPVDIEFAWENSRPSSTDKEKAFLSQIYYNFSNGKVCISRDDLHFREKGLTYG